MSLIHEDNNAPSHNDSNNLTALNLSKRSDLLKLNDLSNLSNISNKPNIVEKFSISSVALPPSGSKLPLFFSPISCGFPSPADGYLENFMSLDEHLIRKPAATFFVRAQGDSMEGAGIYDGDLLIVDRSINATHDMIIVAMIQGDFTLKRLVKNEQGVFLYPENKKYSPIKVTEDSDFQVWGVVIHSIRKHL